MRKLIMICYLIMATASTAQASLKPMPEAIAALESNREVTITEHKFFFEFMPNPANKAFTTGYIFHPGGSISPKAYAPYARSIALAGYPTFILKERMDLAILSPDRAKVVMKAFKTGINNWVFGGHSLGGVVAGDFASKYKDSEFAVKGILLMAAYIKMGTDLSQDPIEAVSLRGSNDGVTSKKDICVQKGL